MPYPATILSNRWWEKAAAIARPYLKSHGQTLYDLTAALDDYQARGIDTLEVFAPFEGGVCYNGLDTLDYYKIDPAIGTRADLTRLVQAAHARQMAVILFINLGYGHEQFPAFLKACDDVRAGVDSPETRMFVWSETGQDTMDRSLAPHFMNDLHGNWRWNERAQKYFWVKWEGERGGYHLPQFNFGDPGWQAESRRIIDYWLQTGIDGMVIDAVNWYIDCNWQITRYSMTDLLNQAQNQFSQPEGAGGFKDDPVPWVREGGFNCIMDYSIKLWREGVDVIRDAVLAGDPRPIEAALRSYRDRVVAAGGICYIDPPNLEDRPLPARLLGAAAVATIGELLILIGDQLAEADPAYQAGLTGLLEARRRYPALSAGGERIHLVTQDDSRFYAFLRRLPGEETMLVVLNFQPAGQKVQVNLAGQPVQKITGITSGLSQPVSSQSIEIELPAYGYAILTAQ